MRQMIAFINGSLSSINLGYVVRSDEGVTEEGRIWKNYWVDSSEKEDEGTVVIWCLYSDDNDSASVAALLSVAEWMRGREFERRVRVAFVRDAEGLPSVVSDLPLEDDEIRFQVTGLGEGSRGLMKTGGPTAAIASLRFTCSKAKAGRKVGE